jgi:hypothetical protein
MAHLACGVIPEAEAGSGRVYGPCSEHIARHRNGLLALGLMVVSVAFLPERRA